MVCCGWGGDVEGGGAAEVGVVLVGEDEGGVAAGEDVAGAVFGVGGVEGDVGAAGFEDGEDGGDEVGGAVEVEGDAGFGGDASFGEGAGEVFGAGVEFGVGEGAGAGVEGDGVGGLCDVGGEGGGDGGGGCVGGGAVGGGQGFGVFGGAEHREVPQGLVGVAGGQAGGQFPPVRGHPGHRPRVIQIRAVLDGADQRAVRRLLELEHEVEGEGVAGDAERLGLQTGEDGRGSRRALEHHHGLDEGHPARVAFGRDRVHHSVEGDLLVVEGLQHRGPGRREEVADRGRAVHVGAQHQRMDEEAYEVLQFGPVAAGGDRAEGHVPLPAPAAEEQLGGGCQQHEEAGAVFPAEPGQPGGGRGRDGEGVDRAGPGPHRGTRAVAGQLQRLQTGQPLLPVRQSLARPRVVGQAVALPGGEVGVLDRERGQRRFEAVQFGGVAGGEFTGEDVQGAAVADDVVHREQQGVPVGAEPQQQDAQERPLPQVERGQQPGAQERVRVLARRQFRLLHRDLQHGVHDLHDPAVDRVEGGPQRLVPGHHPRHRPLQRPGVQRARQTQRETGVVLHPARVVLRQEPQPPLGERGGQFAGAVGRADGVRVGDHRLPGHAGAQQCLHVRRQRADPALPRRGRGHLESPCGTWTRWRGGGTGPVRDDGAGAGRERGGQLRQALRSAAVKPSARAATVDSRWTAAE
nr:hypothetical protein [Streptomyces diastaticus]